jgi:5-methylcytosine-specific restriction enzyme subunit McrC
MRPDIVISHSGVPVLIIDTKWKRLKGAIDDPKRGVGQADIYQMMAYSQVYACPHVMLLYPHHTEIGGAEGLLTSHDIRGTDFGRLSVATVSLSDLTAVGNRLRALVLGAIDSNRLAEAAAA